MADEAPPPPLDVDRLVEVLGRHGVDFVVIGGIAVLAHGHPRATFDLDITTDLARANVARLAAALEELGARARGVDAELLEVDPTDPTQLAGGANWTLVTDAGWIDLMVDVPGARPYEQLRGAAVPVRDGAFLVVGLDDLVRMKQASGRPKDLDDVAALTHQERHGR